MTAARSSEEIIGLFKQYVIPNYTRYPVCLTRGEGSHVWDAEGNRYLDFFPGWGCGLLGHCPPRPPAAAISAASGVSFGPPSTQTPMPSPVRRRASSA